MKYTPRSYEKKIYALIDERGLYAPWIEIEKGVWAWQFLYRGKKMLAFIMDTRGETVMFKIVKDGVVSSSRNWYYIHKKLYSLLIKEVA